MRPHELPLIASQPAVFEDFYREHIDAVEGFVARRVGDPHLAADLTAETFLAAIHSAPSYRVSRGKPRAWLFGIAVNVVHAEYRRAGRERSANSRIEGHRLLDADDVGRLQERIDAEARSRELYAALGELPDGEREIFELFALDDLSPREAAAALGIHPVTARVRLHRARAALRRHLFDNSNPQPIATTSMEV
jgi:RNA polymerase sigma factor (sigma-70 family)